ncbi:MAG: SgcJ/EcaC family oxidoreductase [Planctomycetaceae bacterium]
MPTDEQQIHDLVTTWMHATRAGDTETVLDLMTDDVVFLIPGRPPMNKAEFAASSSAGDGPQPQFDGKSEIQEIQILGDWAFMWTKLEVTVTFPDDNPPMKRAGHTLSVLRKQDGKWRLARDANMLVRVP